MQKKVRFLVLTLNSGEPQLGACKASVSDQEGVCVEHRIFSGLGNIEAHHTLFSEIMESGGAFDLVLRLDADMVLNRPTALKEIAEFFAGHPGTNHLITMVNDHFTGREIEAAHVYTPRVRWNIDAHDVLFVDPVPQHNGETVRFHPEIPIFVEHAPDPSDFQAFHFGFHRALKALPANDRAGDRGPTLTQASILADVEQNYRTNRRRALALTLHGANLVLDGKLRAQTGDKADTDMLAAYEAAAALPAPELHALVAKTVWMRRYQLAVRRIRLGLRLRRLARRLRP